MTQLFHRWKQTIDSVDHSTHLTHLTHLVGPRCALKIDGGSLIAHRACGTTYAAHSIELKVVALRAKIVTAHGITGIGGIT